MVAFGAIFNRGSYLSGVYNIIDFSVTVVNTLPLIIYFAALNSGKMYVNIGMLKSLVVM